MLTLGVRHVGATHLEAICMCACVGRKGGDWKGEVAEAEGEREDEERTGTAREEETRPLVTERYG